MSEQDIPRDSRRVPIARRIQVKFDRFSGFIDEYLANVSPGGIFIRTLTPEAPGQELDFEFRLGDGFELIRGHGEVVWNRVVDEGPSRPAGMGIRFTELSPGSKDLIYRIVDEYAARGGIPFDLARDPSLPPPVPPPPVFGAPTAGAPAGAAARAQRGADGPATGAAGLAAGTGAAAGGAASAAGTGASATAGAAAAGASPAAGSAPPAANPAGTPPARGAAPSPPAAGTVPAAASPSAPRPATAAAPDAERSGAGARAAAPGEDRPQPPAPASAGGHPRRSAEAGSRSAARAGAPGGAAPPGAGAPPAAPASGSKAAGPAPGAPAAQGGAPAAAAPGAPAAKAGASAAAGAGAPAAPGAAHGRGGLPADASFADIAAELARIAPGPGPLPAPDDSSPPASAPHLPNTGMTPEEQFALFASLAPGGHPEGRDPLQEMAEALPPLDELTAEPSAPGEGASGEGSAAPHAMPPPFASVGAAPARVAGSRRGSWLAAGLLVALALVAGGGWFFRDTLQEWTGRGKASAVGAAASAAEPSRQEPLSGSAPGAPAAGATSGRSPGPARGGTAGAGSMAGVPGSGSTAAVAGAGSTAGVPPSGSRTGTAAPTAAPPSFQGGTPAVPIQGAAPAGPVKAPAPGLSGALAAPTSTPAAPALPASPSAPTASQAPPGEAATAVEKITWERARGGLDIVLWGNGAFRPELLDQARLVGPIRELVRIRGISRPFAATQLRVGTPEVLQIRTGFHRDGGSSRLHVVLDLGGPEVVVAGLETAGKQLRLHVRAH